MNLLGHEDARQSATKCDDRNSELQHWEEMIPGNLLNAADIIHMIAEGFFVAIGESCQRCRVERSEGASKFLRDCRLQKATPLENYSTKIKNILVFLQGRCHLPLMVVH